MRPFIWEKEEKMLNNFYNVLIATIHKYKENEADCGNYMGISLLNITGKILAWAFLNTHHYLQAEFLRPNVASDQTEAL